MYEPENYHVKREKEKEKERERAFMETKTYLTPGLKGGESSRDCGTLSYTT